MKIKVLVVDDSSVIRNILTAIIDEQPDMTVVGTAPDPLVARDLIGKLNPDVLTLDIEMPHMNGLAFLKRLMAVRPMPVVMLSSFTQLGSDVAFQALSLGAVDFVGKPSIGAPVDESYSSWIVGSIRGAFAARNNLQLPDARPRDAAKVLPNLGRGKALQLVAVMGAGTGGIEAVREIVTALPDDAPPLVVALQLPVGISRHFVRKLDAESRVTVKEAVDGEPVLPGHAYFAPGGSCMTVQRYDKRGFGIRLQPLEKESMPVDMLFHSAAQAAGASAVGVILTGMGSDGAEGLRAMVARGAHTIAQDEATSLVYGMPKAALENEAVILEAPLPKIAKSILDWASWGELD